ncbi:MAG: tetratricopeptide repeat protein, partial [Candidatus Thorarchaeota archaeon]
DKIFVDREEYIEWMDNALKRCKDKSVVMHLHGIGGIGKSSLLDYWTSTIESTIRLDCEQYSDFYDRLNVLAKGAVYLGVKLERFDVLWQIRQRFVEGVEPVREEGREWAKEVVMAIPFIGSLASIGSAISAVGTKVTPKLKGKYGTVGKWLQETLGKNHIEQLLQILWKDPRRAEFLYLDALLEDINNRKNSDQAILFLMDHFEYVDSEKHRWRYGGKNITENELWRVFLCSLSNCVGIMASRKGVDGHAKQEVEESELLELDRDSCIELMNLNEITDSELQEEIVSVSGGNPFVIGTLCDMAESGSLTPESVESFRSDTLEGVRLKTWRRLFNHVQDLQELVNRAGLLPYFNRNVMNTIAPTMNTDQWSRMLNLSYIKDRGDGNHVMHELARNLVVAELGDRFHKLANEVAELLEKDAEEQEDMKLLGLSISVKGLDSPESALQSLIDITDKHSWRGQFRSAVELLDSVSFANLKDQTIVSLMKTHHLNGLDRIAEAEHLLKEAIVVLETLVEQDPKNNRIYLVQYYRAYGWLLQRLGQPVEAEAMYEKALEIAKETDTLSLWKNTYAFSIFSFYSVFLMDLYRLNKAAELLQMALRIIEQVKVPVEDQNYRVFHLNFLGMTFLKSGRLDEAETVFRDMLDIKTIDVNLLNSTNGLGEILKRTSRLLEAEEVYRQGLETTRRLSNQEEDSAFLKNFVSGYLRLNAVIFRFNGKYIDAEKKYKESLQIARECVSKQPELYLFPLSLVLNDFGVFCYEMGQYSKAKEFYEEAIENYEQLAQDWPDRNEKYLAMVLNNHSILLRETGKSSEARKSYRRAIGITRELVRKYPEPIFHSLLLGNLLNNLGVLHRRMNENIEAEEALREALEVREILTEKSPDAFLNSVATTLNNLGVVLSVTKRLPEAKEISERGLEIRRSLVKKSPEMHNCRLGFALNNLGNIYKLSDGQSKAKSCYEEALEIMEMLVERNPEVYERYFKVILSNLILYHSQQEEDESVEIIRRRLDELGTREAHKQEIWLDEEDTEADPF